MHSVQIHSVFCTFDLFFCIWLLTRDLYISTLATSTWYCKWRCSYHKTSDRSPRLGLYQYKWVRPWPVCGARHLSGARLVS